MISLIIIIFSFIIDGILSNFLPYEVYKLSFFTPLTTLVSLIVVGELYYHKDREYYITCFIVGCLYDLMYTNLLFFNGIMFLIIGVFCLTIRKYIEIDFFKIIILIVLGIVFYEGLSAFLFTIFNLVPITIDRIIYKISHSTILNLIYGYFIYIIIYLIPKKYKKFNIN